jgi:phosphate transport system substrate-binding protein
LSVPAKRLGTLAIAAGLLLSACGSAATPAPSASSAAVASSSAAVPTGPAASSGSSSATGGTAVTYRCTKGDGQLNGAGSTFINPLLTKMAGDYNTKCGVQVNYQSVGSGAGVKDWQTNTVDFGASDAFLADSEIATAATNGAPVEIPATFGAVVVAYNLIGLSGAIKMTPDIIAGIFLGTITTWNDPALAAANPGLNLPSTAISVVHRSDGSGTTSIFSKYLTAVSPAWVTGVGAGDPTKSAGKTVTWPVGQGASGNEGVTQGIKSTDGGVGYIDIAYAIQNQIPFADVQNKSRNFVTASLASIALAANLPSYPADLRFDLVNTDAAQGYPIAGTTWIIVYQDLSKVLKSQGQANALVDFIWWAIHDGQADAGPLDYGSLPPSLLAQDEAAVKSINWAGAPLLP